MKSRCRHFLAVFIGVPGLAAGLLAGCGSREKPEPVPGVAELVEDPILLSRVLDRCNANPASVSAPDCVNARAAVDRVSATGDEQRARKAEEGFERAREARRRQEESLRQAEEARQKRLDQADLPMTPLEPGK
ncbi:MAG: EexN family lipoprotein [Steroidobacteraceae bacterium]